ncbi:MAG: hypothetical protein ABIO70_24345 [Pseudomonadota bacterium]
MEDLDRELRRALDSRDAQRIVDARLARADHFVKRGMLARARQEILDAAAVERSRGADQAEAHCHQMLASLYRLDGDTTAARAEALRALDLAAVGTPVATAACTELGEIATLAGDATAAAHAYAQALEHGKRAGLKIPHQLTLVLRQAEALAHAARANEAAALLADGRARAEQAGELGAAVRCGVAEATLWHQIGDPERALDLQRRIEAQAHALGDHKALADLAMLAGTRALERGELGLASEAIRAARGHALDAADPAAYIASAVALSRALDQAGDRVGAYEALAVGWVTLGDLLGAELAQQAFKPPLLDLARRWGRVAFDAAKGAYEARRRERPTRPV